MMIQILMERVINGESYTMISNMLAESLEKAYSNCRDTYMKRLLNDASERISSFYEYFSKAHKLTLVYTLETLTRLSIHTKNPYMPLEIGLAWHPYLNLPYLPSSSIKGLIRSYMEKYEITVCGLTVSDLFGSKYRSENERSGLLTVSDALPINCIDKLIDVEVISPHYIESRGIIDEARVKPTPLLFPTISRGVKFKLVIGLKETRGKDVQCIVNEIENIIREAFLDGIGAKTSVGFGALTVQLQSKKVSGVISNG